MRGVLVALLLIPLPQAMPAAGEDGCGRFDWPITREVELFSDGFMPVIESSAWLPKEGAFRLNLEPVASALYAVAPERGRDDGYGGMVTMQWVSAGRYQVTLSDDVWIDALQDNRRLAVLATSRRTDCPGVRLSLQVEVESKPLTLQFGGASMRRLDISVLRVR